MSDEQSFAVVTVTVDGVTWTFPKAKVNLRESREFEDQFELGRAVIRSVQYELVALSYPDEHGIHYRVERHE